MKEADIYRLFWQSGLHDDRLQHEDKSVILWQLFFADGEQQAIEMTDDTNDAEKTLCNTIDSYLNTHPKIKCNLLVFSSHSPSKETCDYVIKNLSDKLTMFQWCFVTLHNIERPSCAFHSDSYLHNIPPQISEQNIQGLQALVEAKVQLSTFKIETWSYLRGYLQLASVLPTCLGRSYDKTFGHKVNFPKESLTFKFSRQEEDNNMADDLKQILIKSSS